MKAFGRCFLRPLAAGAAVALAACATDPAITRLESSASAAAQPVAVGDNWTYRVRDGFTGLGRGSQRYRVTGVDGSQIVIAVSREGSEDEVRIYDHQWNWLKHPATNLQSFDYSPAYRAFDFPLAPGKSWKARLTATDPADGRRFPLTIHGRVLGWERVKTPAGEFDALKVRRWVYLDYWELTVRGRSEIVEHEWYAPAVKQAVRREATSQYLSYLHAGGRGGFFAGGRAGFLLLGGGDVDADGGPRFVQDDWLIYELVSYSVR